jgi:hypothetical protein
MKRQWGFDYTLMKGKQKVDGDVGLMFIAYLFTRMRNILGLQGFWEAVRAFLSRSFHPYIPVIECLETIFNISAHLIELYKILCIFTRSTGHLAGFKTDSRYG